MKVSKWMVLVVCLVAFSVLIAGCGKKKPGTSPGQDPEPTPPTELEINIGEELDTLQTLKTQGLPVKHRGFTFNGDKIDFDSNTKELDGVTYTGRFKTGGTGNSQGNNGVSFNAKKDDTLTVLAMSASTSGTGRHLMVAPVGGVGYNLGEVHTTQLEAFTYKIPADGQYVLYSDNGGINIYYISVFTNPPTSEKTLTTAVEGEGEIDLDPPGGSYDIGTVVTLEAKPAVGYKFQNWAGDLSGSDNPTTITMNSNKSVIAVFVSEATTYGLIVNVNDPAMGSVTITPQKDAYNPGETVTLEAVANDGYIFKQWSGDQTGSANPVEITMDEDKTITAEFIAFTPQALPYTEDFETEYENFWTPEYKSLPADPTAPMYYPTSGESKMSIEEGVLYIGDARFTIGELAPYTPTKSGDTATNGVFDLSKPYKISFKIVSVTGSGKNLQVYIDNNTTGAANSIHGQSSRIYSEKVENLTVGETLEIESSVGTESSFICLRVESGVTVGIDDLKIEYQTEE